jgi:hypothetical protein
VVEGYRGTRRLVRDERDRQVDLFGSVQLLGEFVVESILAKFGQTRPYESHHPGLRLGRIRINRIIGVYVKVLSRWRDLRIRVFYVNFGRWGIRPWRDFGFNKPQTEVLEDFFDDVRGLYGLNTS